MDKLELKEILEKHALWFDDEDGGERANLSDANLSYANLSDANLRGANLSDANLRGANLRAANLRDANLRGANLSDANLRAANLSDANLSCANLSCANLSDANLSYANLSDANLRGANLSYANLRDAIGNGDELKTIIADTYQITYTSEVMQIGCKRYSIKEWFEFDDEAIKGMDCGALEWWERWKPALEQIIKISPDVKSKE